MTRFQILLGAIVCFCIGANARQSAAIPDLSAFHFLLGEWTGEGGGSPGQGNGTFSFSMDLQDHIIVRRSRSEYPPTKTRAAFSHNDLMVIYQEPEKSACAIYFDNEGHTIRYTPRISGDGKSISFVSDSMSAGPRFQLLYRSLPDGSLNITFEIAPPASPQNFSKYLEGRAYRTKSIPPMNSEMNKQ